MKPYLTLLLFALAFSVVSAQNSVVISPQSIVVNPKPSFNVEVFVDKDGSGERSPSYEVGETIQIGVRVSESAYVYLYNVRSSGEITQILPNQFDEAGRNNYVQAGQTKYFPEDSAGYTFDVAGPRGLDKVIAVASREPLDTAQLADFGSNPDFASSNQGEASFAQGLSIVVSPKPQDSWVTDTALFYVGSAPQTPVYGTLDINSTPSGANVYVDEQFVGITPVRFGTRSGTHSVRIELSGYSAFSTTVRLNGGQTLPVSGTLGGAQPQSVAVVTNSVLSDALKLSLYPGASLRKLEQQSGRVKAEFETRASLQNIYEDLHDQLRLSGWQLIQMESKSAATKLDADYQRSGQTLKLELDQQGKSGKYKLELRF